MTVGEIVEQYLKDNGYDGLYSWCGECACEVGKLEPCSEMNGTCCAGYRVEGCLPDCGEGCQFHIVKEKPTPSAKEESQ